MATVTIRYWAAAKDAAGIAEETVEAVTLDEALTRIVATRSPGPAGDRLRTVLAGSSFLVNGDPAGKRPAAELPLPEGAVVEVLPAFAGGLGVLAAVPAYSGFSGRLGKAPGLAAHWRIISHSVRVCAVRSQ